MSISAARIPFFATKSFPVPADRLALAVMLVTQVSASALSFPFLLRDARAAAMVIAASWPFTILAAFLTGNVELRPLAGAIIYISAWLTGLALWRVALRTDRARAVGVCIATLLTLGIPLLWYLGAEFIVQSDAVKWASAAGWGPTFGVLAVSLHDPLIVRAWIFAGAHVAVGALGLITCGIALRRRP
jgi:hypothetical protein